MFEKVCQIRQICYPQGSGRPGRPTPCKLIPTIYGHVYPAQWSGAGPCKLNDMPKKVLDLMKDL